MTDPPPDEARRSGWFTSDLQRGALITGILALITGVIVAMIAASSQPKPGSQSGTGEPVSTLPVPTTSIAPASSPPSISVSGQPLSADKYRYGVCADLSYEREGNYWHVYYQRCQDAHNAQMVAVLDQEGGPADTKTQGDDAKRTCTAIVADLTKGLPDEYSTFTLTPDSPTTNFVYRCFAWTEHARPSRSLLWWSN